MMQKLINTHLRLSVPYLKGNKGFFFTPKSNNEINSINKSDLFIKK